MAELQEFEEVLRQHVVWRTPADEVAGVVRLVARQLQACADAPLTAVYVAVPNKVWLNAFARAFAAARISCFSPKQAATALTSAEPLPLEDFVGSVVLGSYGGIAAIRPLHLFATGLVEGFYPVGAEDAAAIAAEERVLADVLAEVPGTVVFSSFKRATPEEARSLRLSALRQRREHGAQVAVITHSRFIDGLGDAAPAQVSGEQFLMTLFG